MALFDPVSEMPLNINISAYRVLFILLMLVRYGSLNLRELNRLLVENPLIGRAYNAETLTKYINTLREVGCPIPRSTIRNDYSYELQANPFPLVLEPAEWMVAQKVLTLLANHSDEVMNRDYATLFGQWAWAAQLPRPETGQGASLIQESAEISTQQTLCNVYRAYCQAAFVLELYYPQETGEEALLVVEPHEVLERQSHLLLLGLDRQSQQPVTLNIEQILSVRQLPLKNRRQAVSLTVVFALYGRLAKSYRLYPDEKIIYRSETETQVKAKVLETSNLMARLLKYGDSCQILAPDSFREAMGLHLRQLLKTLAESPGPEA